MMKQGRYIAPAMAIAIGLGGCAAETSDFTDDRATDGEAAEAVQDQPQLSAEYFPNGTMILHIDAPESDDNYMNGPYFPSVLRYCEPNGAGQYDLVESGNGWNVGSSISRTAGHAACANGTLTQEDFPDYPLHEY